MAQQVTFAIENPYMTYVTFKPCVPAIVDLNAKTAEMGE